MPRRFAATLALCLALAVPAARADEAAISAVIGAQMEAFRAGDPAAAFDHASPMIQRMFGTPERFGTMVATGYPPIWKPGPVRFLGLREEGGRLQSRVEVTDGAGMRHYFDYEMVETAAGWKINGVRPVAGIDTGV